MWFRMRLLDRVAITQQSGRASPHLRGDRSNLAGPLEGEHHGDELEIA